MTLRRETRGPFWKAVLTVLFRNSRGMEALATLAVLYVHFRSMLPYCYEQLDRQRAEIDAEGEEAWLARNLQEPGADAGTGSPRDLGSVAEAGSAAVGRQGPDVPDGALPLTMPTAARHLSPDPSRT
jgi:hypothetical protein